MTNHEKVKARREELDFEREKQEHLKSIEREKFEFEKKIREEELQFKHEELETRKLEIISNNEIRKMELEIEKLKWAFELEKLKK